VLAQTYKDVEIIVSDNHSTDNTREVVAGYEERGVRLVVCPDAPVATGSPLDNCLSAIQNWNSLCELGGGAYVGIYHADDIYEPGLVARQLEVMERRPECSGVFPTFRIIDEEGQPLGTSASVSSEPREEWFDQIALIRRMLRVGHNVSSSGPLIRRSSWRQAGELDGERFEQAADTEFWIRLAGIGPIAVLKPPLVRYRVHPRQDSPHGFTLYRHRPLPIIPVLRRCASQASLHEQLDQEDRLHLDASCAEEDIRVAINLCRDGRGNEAKDFLDHLPTCGPSMVRVLWREHRLLSLVRLLAGKALACALQLGLGERAASTIARSRIGFSGWG
jgi:hypothetical protein